MPQAENAADPMSCPICKGAEHVVACPACDGFGTYDAYLDLLDRPPPEEAEPLPE